MLDYINTISITFQTILSPFQFFARQMDDKIPIEIQQIEKRVNRWNIMARYSKSW